MDGIVNIMFQKYLLAFKISFNTLKKNLKIKVIIVNIGMKLFILMIYEM